MDYERMWSLHAPGASILTQALRLLAAQTTALFPGQAFSKACLGVNKAHFEWVKSERRSFGGRLTEVRDEVSYFPLT